MSHHLCLILLPCALRECAIWVIKATSVRRRSCQFSTGTISFRFLSPVFRGRGGLDFELTLTYNSQDWRNDLFGYGWSFPYNARAQLYSDIR